jgi:hypothetical protein
MQARPRHIVDQEILPFSFYLIQSGKVYARSCVQNKISKLLPQNDAVSVVAKAASLDLKRSLAMAGQELQSDLSSARNLSNQRECS